MGAGLNVRGFAERKALSLAKITRPKASGVVLRKRLFRMLDNGKKKPVVWVSAPAGSGKTTLVSSWIDAKKLPCIWYQVDQGDADIASFFYYLGLAAKKAAPRYRKPLPLLTPEYILGIPTFTRRYFENLCGRLKTPFSIVLDNYQDVHEQSGFHDVIVNGMDALPHGITVIILSRSNHPAQYARLRANNSIELLGWNDIRFTLDETEEVINLRSREKISENVLKRFYSKSKGWAAGLVLFTERFNAGEADMHFLKGENPPEEIFEYFAGEVFSRMDETMQDFLLKTSLFPGMDAHMAERLTGAANASEILSDLNRNNCFTERRLHSNPVYTYHPLFREYLLFRLKGSFTQDDTRRLQRKAAQILDESEKFEDAFPLLRDAADWEGINSLVLRHAGTLVKQGRSGVLEGWITSLSGEIIDKDPWLLYWLGISRMPFNPVESTTYLENAFHIFNEQRDSVGVFLSWSGIVDSILFGWDTMGPLDRSIPILDGLIKTFGGFPSKEIEGRVTSSMFMALVHGQPQHPEIELWAERVYALSQGCEDVNLKAMILSTLVYHKIVAGKMGEAASLIDSCRRLAQSRDATPLAILTMKWAESIYLTLQASYARCLKVVSEGLSLSESTGVHIMDFYLLGHGALSAFNVGDIERAEGFLERMGSSNVGARLTAQSFYHFLMSYLALLRGNTEQAITYAESSLNETKEAGYPLPECLAHFLMAQAMHESKEDKKALSHLKECLKIGRLIKFRHVEFMAFLSEAHFAFDRGDDNSGISSLSKAMALGRENGHTGTYLWRQDVMVRLCLKALANGIETGYVQELIRKRNLVLESPLHDGSENWPWPVKVFSLGRFSVLKEGKHVQFSRKAQKRPLTMLKALIAFGGRDVSEEQLSDALWPDADGDAAHSALSTTIQRLRLLIGDARAIQVKEGRVSLDPRYCYVDVWAFESILGEADSAWKMKEIDKAIQLTERAIALYNGEFLHGDTGEPWTVSMRERLRSKFIRSLSRPGHYYQEKGQWDKAIECYQKGLEVDELSEEFYRSLMTCYRESGRMSEAISAYNRCRKTLFAMLGIEPSPKTEAVYKSLR